MSSPLSSFEDARGQPGRSAGAPPPVTGAAIPSLLESIVPESAPMDPQHSPQGISHLPGLS